MLAQLEKQDQTKEALQKLITALRTQVDLVKEEGELKLREETQKRIDCSKQFQDTMTELSTLIESNSEHNNKLKKENTLMAEKLMTLLKEYEGQERKVQASQKEHELKVQEILLLK